MKLVLLLFHLFSYFHQVSAQCLALFCKNFPQPFQKDWIVDPTSPSERKLHACPQTQGVGSDSRDVVLRNYPNKKLQGLPFVKLQKPSSVPFILFSLGNPTWNFFVFKSTFSFQHSLKVQKPKNTYRNCRVFIF